MKGKWIRLIPGLFAILLLISCGSEQQPSQATQSYKDTKTIVLDVLKSKEAEKAIQDASQKKMDQTAKLLSSGEGQQIQVAVKDMLTTNDAGVKMLEKTMSDPRFAGDFAKALQTNMKQMHKDLLKDPEYQKAMIEVMGSSDYEKIVLEAMKSPAYRQQMMNVMKESLQSPLYKDELINMFQAAIKQQMAAPQPEAQQEGKKGKGKKGKDQKQDQKKEQGQQDQKQQSS